MANPNDSGNPELVTDSIEHQFLRQMNDSAGRRGIWTLVDLSVSSGSNFLLSLMVVRSLNPEGFGAFSVVMSCYFLGLEGVRALATEPALSRPIYSSDPAWPKHTSSLAGFVLLLGFIGSMFLVAGTFIAHAELQNALLVLAVFLPFLLLQDACRYIFFSDGQPRRAFLNDLAWLVGQVVGFLVVVMAFDSTTLTPFLAVWGGAGALAAGLGMVQAKCRPNLDAGLSWFRRHRDLGGPFLLEFIVNRGSTQLVLLGLGAIAGLRSLGLFSASRLVMGPFSILQMGSTAFGLPEAVRLARSNPARLKFFARWISIVLASSASLYALLAWNTPSTFGEFLFGPTWQEAVRLLPLTALWIALDAVSQGPRIGLKALGDGKGNLRARTVTSPMILLGGLSGAALGGAVGTCLGLAVGLAASSAVWWLQFKASLTAYLSTRTVDSSSPTTFVS